MCEELETIAINEEFLQFWLEDIQRNWNFNESLDTMSELSKIMVLWDKAIKILQQASTKLTLIN